MDAIPLVVFFDKEREREQKERGKECKEQQRKLPLIKWLQTLVDDARQIAITIVIIANEQGKTKPAKENMMGVVNDK